MSAIADAFHFGRAAGVAAAALKALEREAPQATELLWLRRKLAEVESGHREHLASALKPAPALPYRTLHLPRSHTGD